MLSSKGQNVYLIFSGSLISIPLYFFLVWKKNVGSHEVSLGRAHAYLKEYSFLEYNWVNVFSILLLLFSLSFILRLLREKNYIRWLALGLLILNGFLFLHYLRLWF